MGRLWKSPRKRAESAIGAPGAARQASIHTPRQDRAGKLVAAYLATMDALGKPLAEQVQYAIIVDNSFVAIVLFA